VAKVEVEVGNIETKGIATIHPQKDVTAVTDAIFEAAFCKGEG
jgi:hypothetical protein